MGHNDSPKNQRVLTIISAVVALAVVIAAVSCNKSYAAQTFDPNAACTYADNVEWKRWGGAPYGPTAEAALADSKLDWYLKCSTAIPETLKPAVKAAIRANPKGEKTAYLTPDMTLLEMASGPDHTHHTQHLMRNVKVARIVEALGIVLAAETPTWSVKGADGSGVVVGDPFRCGNLSVIRILPAPPVPPAPPAPAPPARGPIRSCPEWWVLEVANWGNEAFYLSGIEQTHAQEKFGVKFAGAKHVSRVHGPQLRAAYAEGKIAHSKVPRNFRVSLIMTSEARNGDTTITEEKFYRDIVVVGSKEVAFPIADIERWDAIRVIAADGDEVLSPPLFAETGFHEMRFFDKMPGTSHGEWDNPKQKPCYKTEHWIEQPQVMRKQ